MTGPRARAGPPRIQGMPVGWEGVRVAGGEDDVLREPTVAIRVRVEPAAVGRGTSKAEGEP